MVPALIPKSLECLLLHSLLLTVQAGNTIYIFFGYGATVLTGSVLC